MIEKPFAEIYLEIATDQAILRDSASSLLQDYFLITPDKNTADILVFSDFDCYEKDKINIYLADSDCVLSTDSENLYVFQPFKNGHLGKMDGQAYNLSKFIYNIAIIENMPIFHNGTIRVIG
jgi:hypothetical protein